MELKFQKSTCKYLGSILREVRNQEQTQEIKLSDGMPDIGRVVACWGMPVLRSKEWRSDCVAFSGGVMVWVLYAPEDGTDVRCVESWIPFQMEWDIPVGTPEGKICIRPAVRFVDARSVTARKLMVRAGIAALIEALAPMEAEIPTPGELDEDIQMLTTTYPVRLRTEAGEKSFLMDEELTLPGSCPLPVKLITYTLQPEITEQKVSGNRAVFKGNANLHILYRSEEGQLHTWDFELPFSQLGNLDSVPEGDAKVEVTLCATNLEVNLDDEGHIRLKCGLLGQFSVSQRMMLEFMEDAYSPSRDVRLIRENLTLPTILENRQERVFSEQSVPQEANIVVDTTYFPDFPRQRRTGNEVELEMPGQFQVLFYGEDGHLQASTARWEGSMRLPADEQTSVLTDVSPKGSPQAMMGNNQITLKADSTLSLESMADQEFSIVAGLEVGQPISPDLGRPSLILRRAGDNRLWDIAKETGSTVEIIRQANGLQGEPERGQILLIPVG